MITKIKSYLKNNILSAIIQVFLFFIPSFNDLRQIGMNESFDWLNTLFEMIPNFITGGILVFLFVLYRKSVIENEEQKEDLEMIRYVNEYRKAHIFMESYNHAPMYAPMFFTDETKYDAQTGTSHTISTYEEKEKNGAIAYFIKKKHKLHSEAVNIVNRYYEPN